MFIGSIDRDSRLAVEKVLDSIDRAKTPNVFVGCSGNFTFDRIAAAKGFRVYSNDVSLYSRLIAALVRNEDFPTTCTDAELSGLFARWSQSKYTPIIQVMFAMKYGQFVDAKNDYQRTMLENYRQGAEAFCQKNIEKFSRGNVFNFEIADFFFGDFKKHLEFAEKDSVIFLYAPTYKGGYEKIFNFVEKSFDYERPQYDIFDSKTAGPYYRRLLDSTQACIYSDILYDETLPFLRGQVEKGDGKRTVFFYSSIENAKSFHLVSNASILDKTPSILKPDDSFSGSPSIKVVLLPVKIVNHFKHIFVSNKVNYSLAGDMGLGFLIDGKLFGFATFAKMLRTVDTKNILFLHSDFCVVSSIDRLSKLVLFLLRSKDVAKIVSRHYVHTFKGMQTSVYTDKPVSMKYRGVFKKMDSQETGKLTYIADFTNLTLQECFDRWKNGKPIT